VTAPIFHAHIEQNTPEWDAIRAGKWTASSGAKIMGGLTTQGLKDLIKDVAWGRVYGSTDRGYTSKAMDRGHELEPEARDWFAFERDVVVEQVGFVEHGRISNLGWSPDGLHGQRRRGVEIKCLLHKAWMDVEDDREVPSEYRWQVKFACMVGQLDGLDFVAYHPAAGGIVIPVEITDSDKDQIEGRIAVLEPMVQARVDRLMERMEKAA
jgi:putative phage-type endonuclease